MPIIFRKKLYNEFLARKASVFTDMTNHVAFYETHGTRHAFRMKSGRLGIFELLSWLDFQEKDEPYIKPKKAYWMFTGYKDGKQINNLTYKEFKKERKLWKSYGDVAPNAERIKDVMEIAKTVTKNMVAKSPTKTAQK